jgi:hypothetical protein
MGLISPAMRASTAPTSISSSGVGAAAESARQKENQKKTEPSELNAPSNFSTSPNQAPNRTQSSAFPSSPRIGDPKTQISVPVSDSVTAGAAEISAQARSQQTTTAVAGTSSHMEVEVNGRHTVYDTDPVSGRPNARATGSMFPAVLRHDADVSVSGLHIPGGFYE